MTSPNGIVQMSQANDASGASEVVGSHTKGPWVVRYNGYRPHQIEAPSGYAGPGGITSVTRGNAISFPSSREGHANALLLAAAPDLLATLEALLRSIDEMDPDQSHCSTVAFMACRAAIARATCAPSRTAQNEVTHDV